MTIEFLDHTADTAVRISGADPEEFFREAARAFFEILLTPEGLARVDRSVEMEVDIDGPDGETVLVDFLNELLYAFDARQVLLPEVQILEARFEGPDETMARLRAALRGGPFDPERHVLRTQVKAATYHGLEIRRYGGRIEAVVVFDL